MPLPDTPLTVVVIHDVATWARQEYAQRGYTGDELTQLVNEEIEIWSGAAGLAGQDGFSMRVDDSWDIDFVYDTVVHELTHIYQFRLASSAYPNAPKGLASAPVWLSEGMASLFEDLVTSHSTGNQFRDWGAVAAAANACATLLEDVTYHGGDGRDKYTAGRQASLLLASMFGVRGLFDLFIKWRPGEQLASSFERTFGISVNDFYGKFNKYCADGMPPLHVEAIVDYPASRSPLDHSWTPSCEVIYPLHVREPENNSLLVALTYICDYVSRLGWLTYDSRAYLHDDPTGLSNLLMGSGEGRYDPGYLTEALGPNGNGFVAYTTSNLNEPIPGWMILDATYHFTKSMFFGHHPEWLQLGLARAVPPLAIGCAEGWSYPHSREGHQVALQHKSGLISIETFKVFHSSDWLDVASYVGQEAIELLLATYGQDKVGIYLQYPRELNWRTRFESAFGATVDEFYELYQRHWEAGLPDIPVSAC